MNPRRQLIAAAAVLGLSVDPALAQTTSTTSMTSTSTTPVLPTDPIPASPPATTHPDQVISRPSPPATTHPDQVISRPNETSTAPRTAEPAVPSAPRQVALTG